MTENTPKILYLVPNGGYFYSHRLPMAYAAQSAGLNVSVITNPGQYQDKIEQENIRVIACDITPGGLNPLNEFKILRAITQIYREEKPHIVHHVTLKAILYGAIAAWITRVPAIINAIAGLGYIFNSRSVKARILRLIVSPLFHCLLCRANSWVLLQNKDDYSLLLKRRMIRTNRSIIIPGSGVELKKFTPTPLPPVKKGVVCTFSGRMIGIKGLATLQKTFYLLERSAPHIKLQLCGTPDPNNPGSWNERDLYEWAEAPNVTWQGYCQDMALIWRNTHIAIQPSDGGEGIPKSLLEAAASGRPIIATDVPGCREVVQNGRNGRLVPPQDPDALAEATIQLCQDVGLCRQMAEQSPHIIREKGLSAVDIGQQTQEVYMRLLST